MLCPFTISNYLSIYFSLLLYESLSGLDFLVPVNSEYTTRPHLVRKQAAALMVKYLSLKSKTTVL